MHPTQNTSHFLYYIFIMQFAISGSSAIENISVDDNTATITFNGGRSYDYTVNDVTAFVTALTNVMSKQESVGSFVNKQIKSETLQKVAAWSSLEFSTRPEYMLQWSRRDTHPWTQSQSNQSRRKHVTGSRISWTRTRSASLSNDGMVWCSSHHKTRGIISGSGLTTIPIGCYTDHKREEVCPLCMLKLPCESCSVYCIGHSGLVADRGWCPGHFLMDCNNYFKAGAVSMWLLRQQQYPLPPLISYKIPRIGVLCRVSGQFADWQPHAMHNRFLGVIVGTSNGTHTTPFATH